MCGIIGYTGSKNAVPILMEGLRALEYRGYDSAGIFVPGYAPIKAVGSIDNLATKITKNILGTTGIAHTRWATHGIPSVVNAHPHLDMSGSIALAHNGIIENFRELKEGLITQGVEFKSETDTEVLVKLIGSMYRGDLLKAVLDTLSIVRGTYGIIVTSTHHPDTIITARLGSPVVIGLGDDGNIVSSDSSAFLAHTKKVIYLEDGECAVVTKDSCEVVSIRGKKIVKTPEVIDMDIESVQKHGFEHFMLKEINEIPEVIENTIRGRLVTENGKAKLGGLEDVFSQIISADRLVIVGCGSAYYAGQVGKYLLEEYAGIPTEVELGSEYRYMRNLADNNSILIAVTQSGETADTLASVRTAKENNILTLGIVNVAGSTIARETDAGIHNHAGPEIAVASTKAFISQLVTLVLFTLLVAREKGMTQIEGQQIIKELKELPDIIRSYLKNIEGIKLVAKKYAHHRSVMLIGRKFHSPVAYEGSLKLKEVTYIHAEAYAAGELKHGPIAMLDENFPVVALVPQDGVYEKMISNIEEVKARKVPVVAIATEGDDRISELVDDVLFVPKVHPVLQPIVSTIPLQLLAYYIGLEKGLNVDRPRNLAKSVTVE